MFFKAYSVRRAITGSFLAADLDGIKPEISVKTTLIVNIISATHHGNKAIFTHA